MSEHIDFKAEQAIRRRCDPNYSCYSRYGLIRLHQQTADKIEDLEEKLEKLRASKRKAKL